MSVFLSLSPSAFILTGGKEASDWAIGRGRLVGRGQIRTSTPSEGSQLGSATWEQGRPRYGPFPTCRWARWGVGKEGNPKFCAKTWSYFFLPVSGPTKAKGWVVLRTRPSCLGLPHQGVTSIHLDTFKSLSCCTRGARKPTAGQSGERIGAARHKQGSPLLQAPGLTSSPLACQVGVGIISMSLGTGTRRGPSPAKSLCPVHRSLLSQAAGATAGWGEGRVSSPHASKRQLLAWGAPG